MPFNEVICSLVSEGDAASQIAYLVKRSHAVSSQASENPRFSTSYAVERREGVRGSSAHPGAAEVAA